MENKNQPSEPCQICGDIGNESSIMTCLNCRKAREHIYCAKFRLKSVPYMWLCEVCRSTTGILKISNVNSFKTNKTANSCALRPELSSNVVEEEISLPSLHQKTSNGCLKLKLGKGALETNKTDDSCALRPELSRKSCVEEEEISTPSLQQETLNGCLKVKLDKRDSLVSSDTSPGKKQRLSFLAFPTKRRTAFRKDVEETNRQGFEEADDIP